MLGKFKEKADLSKLKDGASALKDSAEALKGSSDDKLKEVANEFNAIAPIIKMIGYSITEVEVELGMPPKIVPHFTRTDDMSEDEMNEIIEKHKDKKLTYLILSSLAKASSLQNSIQLSNLKFTEVEIEVGAIPSVKLKFG